MVALIGEIIKSCFSSFPFRGHIQNRSQYLKIDGEHVPLGFCIYYYYYYLLTWKLVSLMVDPPLPIYQMKGLSKREIVLHLYINVDLSKICKKRTSNRWFMATMIPLLEKKCRKNNNYVPIPPTKRQWEWHNI